ncbi:hypothetical protein HDV06_002880 [Boothiomyces sp. JEL0866]|nr:hypothetical protein HDV06_002880 [Boothiomyces sp. JEL0866]
MKISKLNDKSSPKLKRVHTKDVESPNKKPKLKRQETASEISKPVINDISLSDNSTHSGKETLLRSKFNSKDLQKDVADILFGDSSNEDKKKMNTKTQREIEKEVANTLFGDEASSNYKSKGNSTKSAQATLQGFNSDKFKSLESSNSAKDNPSVMESHTPTIIGKVKITNSHLPDSQSTNLPLGVNVPGQAQLAAYNLSASADQTRKIPILSNSTIRKIQINITNPIPQTTGRTLKGTTIGQNDTTATIVSEAPAVEEFQSVNSVSHFANWCLTNVKVAKANRRESDIQVKLPSLDAKVLPMLLNKEGSHSKSPIANNSELDLKEYYKMKLAAFAARK